MMHDPYERFNFWSHAIPAASFLGMLAAALANAIPGGVALATFCTCACITHALSALTHVYPDSHSIVS